MALFRGALVALLALPLARSLHLQTALEAQEEAIPEAEPQQLLGGRAGEVHAVAEVATERAAEYDALRYDALALEGDENPDCPMWCFVSHQYWHVKCTFPHCNKCPMCGPYVHDRKEALPEAEPQQLLGGRDAEVHAVAEVATERAAESDVAVVDQGDENPNCPMWCFVSHQYWHVKCTFPHCNKCPMCGPYVHDRQEALPEAEPQQLLGGRDAEAHAVAKVATERAAESDAAVAAQGDEDPNCPMFCFVNHQYWHVKCSTFSHCANCPMCGPYVHDRKEALPEAEPQQLLGDRAAEARAAAEVATERAAESHIAVADEVVEDPNCPLWCFVTKKNWHVQCAYSRCNGCPMCGPWKHDRQDAPTAEDDPEGVMAALEWHGA